MVEEAEEERFAAFLDSKQSARDLFRRYQKTHHLLNSGRTELMQIYKVSLHLQSESRIFRIRFSVEAITCRNMPYMTPKHNLRLQISLHSPLWT
jgi:hypothetical protein